MKLAEAVGGGWDADSPTCAQNAYCSSRKGNVVSLPRLQALVPQLFTYIVCPLEGWIVASPSIA